MAQRDNYDTPWKVALSRYLRHFFAFYFRSQHSLIDWSARPRFLDKELEQASRSDSPAGAVADKLVSVRLKDGSEQWILIHIEVQCQRDASLANRVFTYNYRIYDLYRKPVASLVILADDVPEWRPDTFRYSLMGTEMGIHFPTAKLLDYSAHVDQLLGDRNPFALVTAAHLLALQTRDNPLARYREKWRLIKLLYERGWSKRRIIDLFKVINWLMALPDELEHRLWRNVDRLERRRKVEWISPLERSFMDKGLKQGLQQGLQQGLERGLERGRQEGAAQVLERLLAKRFGPLTGAARKRLAGATLAQLEKWTERALDAPTLRQVFE